jgi:hypothetical protein
MAQGTAKGRGVLTGCVGTAAVLGHRVPRAWVGPWGHGGARDNGEHGVWPSSLGGFNIRCPTLRLIRAWKRERGSWVGTRRVALPYVSSCPPLKTVRTTFMVYGFTPAGLLRNSTQRSFPFRQLHRTSPVDSLRVRWVPLVRSFRRLGAFASSPHPGVPSCPGFRRLCPIRLCLRALACRWALAYLLPTRLPIPQAVSRVHHGRLKQNAVGGVFISLPRPLFVASQSLDSGSDRLTSVTAVLPCRDSLGPYLQRSCLLSGSTGRPRRQGRSGPA